MKSEKIGIGLVGTGFAGARSFRLFAPAVARK